MSIMLSYIRFYTMSQPTTSSPSFPTGNLKPYHEFQIQMLLFPAAYYTLYCMSLTCCNCTQCDTTVAAAILRSRRLCFRVLLHPCEKPCLSAIMLGDVGVNATSSGFVLPYSERAIMY
jgi:hypothetical protein